MKVEIWSDFACPFCYIGKHSFHRALVRFEGEVEVRYRSFELDPHAERGRRVSIHQVLAEKYGRPIEWAKQMNADVAMRAASLGMNFHMDQIIPTNTFDAHRLSHWAMERGAGEKVMELIFSAYFCEGRDIGEPETLRMIAKAADLDGEGFLKDLSLGAFKDEVRADEREAIGLGFRGVPYFLIDRKLAISGAQSEESFLKALQEARR